MIGNRYGCGCGSNTKGFGCNKCCPGSSVQTPPTPCCEPHSVDYQFGGCLFNQCSVTTTADPGGFFLTFSSPFAKFIPVVSSQLYFWHSSAGLMQVLGFNGVSFNVIVVDPQKAGIQINPEDCILPFIDFVGAGVVPSVQRCLAGIFYAPADEAEAEMFIVNGTAIPIGATVTITWQGNVGSYVVTGYEGASGNVYVYTVSNTGSGLTPGTMVDGGVANAGCAVPVEVISTVDICQTSETQELDVIAGCFNGSPRSLKATSPGQTPVSGDDLTFGLQTLSNTNCCLTTLGCLKFTAADGCGESDTTTVTAVGVECLTKAWEEAELYGNFVPADIGGFPFLIIAWNEETRAITLMPVGDAAFDGEPVLQLDAGTQICLGDCCNQCLLTDQTTSENYNNPDFPELAANFAITDPGDLPYSDAGPTFYLIGTDQDGLPGVQTLTDTYKVSGDPLPKHSDNLLLRQKICNTSPVGCNQDVEFDYNWNMIIDALPAGFRLHWEIGHYLAESATLADGTTPNPNTYASSSAKVTGYDDGPIFTDEGEDSVTPGTGLGFAGPDQPKKYPDPAGMLRDYSELRKCDCINTVLWLFIMIEPLPGADGSGNVSVAINYRRRIKKKDKNRILNPSNDPACENWAGGSE